ncbi:MAG: phosphotransferase, partial [archaeon]
EGKYHCSACNSCYAKFSLAEAGKLGWKCPNCNGAIKKGVRDRIMELANHKEEIHPDFRPDYSRLLPLAEIIQLSMGIASPTNEKVQAKWKEYIDAFGTEINVLVEAKAEDLLCTDKSSAESILAFRNGWVHYIPGGGGNYGKPIICLSQREFDLKKIEMKSELGCGSKKSAQKSLAEF